MRRTWPAIWARAWSSPSIPLNVIYPKLLICTWLVAVSMCLSIAPHVFPYHFESVLNSGLFCSTFNPADSPRIISLNERLFAHQCSAFGVCPQDASHSYYCGRNRRQGQGVHLYTEGLLVFRAFFFQQHPSVLITQTVECCIMPIML